ncbi:MAG: DUF72 domain-containing protein [Phycisphaerae bacterium]|nr:DUF72 domain-containing protein [Phycisphaerae bacterium]
MIRIGHSGWSYPDWTGIVYPRAARARLDALSYLSRYFNALEINTSHYQPLAPQTAERWLRRVADAPDFRFTAKLWRQFTHADPKAITPADWKLHVQLVRQGMNVLASGGRLACLLMQFPWSFRQGPPGWERIARLAESFRDYPLAIELRHASWDDAEARSRLKALGIALCNIDQPPLHECLRPADHVTAPIGYVRLHGRRVDTWFAPNVPVYMRYDYLYSPVELSEWVPRIRAIAERAESVFVFANNHYRGQGPANAFQLQAMLSGSKVRVPPRLLSIYPSLREYADAEPEPDGQGRLFDDQ